MFGPSRARDHRIDFLRGLALVTIFINHVPGTLLGAYTSRNFGFSDAAEAFVLISGISTGLAYSPFRNPKPDWRSALRPWKRAFTIWWVQAVIVLVIYLILAMTQHLPAVAELAAERNVTPALENPIGLLAPLLLLSHQFNCADILPLYILFMLAAPGLIASGARWPRALMAASIIMWLAAGLRTLNLPTWPTDQGWFFNPLSWQLLFVAGLLTGLAVTRGRRTLPVRPFALLLAAVFLCFSALWMQFPALADRGYDFLWMVQERLGIPWFLASFDKTYLAPLRLLHILALAYVLSAWPYLHRIAGSPWTAFFAILGRNALPVFATGTVLAYIIQIIREISPPSDKLDILLIGAGLILQFLVALARDRLKRRAPAVVAPAPDDGSAGVPGRKRIEVFRREWRDSK